MSFWDTRYSASEFVYGKEPNDFLRQSAPQIPKGPVLALADGDGRNGVFLAKCGHDVHAVDLSAVGLKKASAYALAEGVRITTQVADLADYAIEPAAWSGIVSISAHLPAPVRRALHRRVVSGLRPGGLFILEAFTPRQLEIGGVGGPGPAHPDFYMSLADLRVELAGLEFIHEEELDRDVNEGAFHRGRAAVVQVIARRPA